ncbi:hypothetical protein MNBD_ALPHA02-1211 [hydrothermal vent metagenome]|uniref:Uncharacterized protein n=1 Tax=hydrothermal vent metagenome TaxID=652676 RepID=A0A3B0RA76_9ZZZZ
MRTVHKIVFSLISLLFLGGCSVLKTQDPVYSATVITRADLLSGEALLGPKAKDMILPEDHVMQVNDTMRKYLNRYVPRKYGETTRVKVLAKMIFGQGALGMTYDASQTYTARDAFLKTEGNCLAFSYLFAALAREQGLKVSFQEVEIPPQWSSVGDELYYLSRHVNIRIHMREMRDLVIDIDRVNYKSHYRAWKISDDNAIALYYSNKGTDYLYDGDYENAFRYLVKGLNLAPYEAALWSNLGVLYRMKEMYGYAEKAYFIALKYDNSNQSALSNLSVLYDHMGEVEKSEYYFRLAKEHQMKNPYYRYHQAQEAFDMGDYGLALYHLKGALKRQNNEQKFYNLMAETYVQLGQGEKADQAWAKAKKLVSYP